MGAYQSTQNNLCNLPICSPWLGINPQSIIIIIITYHYLTWYRARLTFPKKKIAATLIFSFPVVGFGRRPGARISLSTSYILYPYTNRSFNRQTNNDPYTNHPFPLPFKSLLLITFVLCWWFVLRSQIHTIVNHVCFVLVICAKVTNPHDCRGYGLGFMVWSDRWCLGIWFGDR